MPTKLTLTELLEALPKAVKVGDDIDLLATLTGASSDSRLTLPGHVFFAYPGIHTNGTTFLSQAFSHGCAVAIVPADAEVDEIYQSRCIYVNDIRPWSAKAAALAYGKPSERLLTLGVTGTNGKTSTCYLTKALLEAAGHRVLLMTTVCHQFEDWRRDTPNTTPDAPLLQQTLAFALSQGATAAVIEVSAHGILLDRVTDTVFDGLLFTNLARDHQDFFDGLQPYYAQKCRLFTESRFHKPGCVCAVSVVDEWGTRLAAEIELPYLTFGPGKADISTDSLHSTKNGLAGSIEIKGLPLQIDTNLRSDYNKSNLAGAVALLAQILPDVSQWQVRLTQPVHVPGRLNYVTNHTAPFSVVVDFAHTDSALDNLLRGLASTTKGKIIVVFGAGGDKDPLRRYTLPEIVVSRSGLGVITLDNPRSEAPDKIIETMVNNWKEIAKTVATPADLIVEPDREKAIAIALNLANPGDTVVLAGKGHETGQIFHNQIIPHDDFEIAAHWLEAHFPLSHAARIDL